MKKFKIWANGKLHKFRTEREALEWIYYYRKRFFDNSAMGLHCWFETNIDTDGPFTDEGQKELDHIIYANTI